MNHRWVEKRLSAFAAGELPAVERAMVRRHVETCTECMEWLETVAFFREALGSDGALAGAEHLSSAEIAECAVGRSDLPAGAREHLASCPECHRALTLTRQATRAAGGEESIRGWPSVSERPVVRRLAAAAGIALVLVAASLLLRPREPVESSYRVPAGYLVGEQVIDSPGSIEATDVRIDSGSSISFKARDVVVLGEGFVVAQEASLTVEVTNPPDRQNG